MSGGRPARSTVVVAGLVLALAGCAGVAPAPPTAAPPPGPTWEHLVAPHRERAEALERDGQWRPAAEQWKIALTIAPDDARSRAALQDLQLRIERRVTERMVAGRAALARGSEAEARRQFLMVLALDPTNRAAFQALQEQTRELVFLSHTVRRGDTLQSLAQRYYGDRSRAEVIWETNQLPPSPRLVVGSTLKIPEIPGVPSVPRLSAAPPRSDASREEHEEINPLLAEAREALDRKDYREALADLDKLLTGSPGSADGLALKKTVLYQQGKSQLDSRRYGDAYRTLNQLARIQPTTTGSRRYSSRRGAAGSTSTTRKACGSIARKS